MRNIAPSRSLTRRANQFRALAFLLGAVGIFVIAISILLNTIPFSTPSNPGYSTYLLTRSFLLALGLLIVVVAVALAVRAFTWRTDNDLAMITGRTLSTTLDDRYTLIRNVSKREIGYVDAVLVGPPGALVFRILDAQGVFANDGANWMQRDTRGEFKVARIRPTVECIADIRKVREYLGKRNMGEIPVYGVVVFTREAPYVQLMAQNPVVPITHLSMLLTNLQDSYLAAERIDATRVAATVKALFD